MASSPPPPDPPTAVPLALVPIPAPPSSRRLPPPCWSPDETLALIDAYRDKWYSLGRGNLKATHWQEVADAIASRCPNASPPKTPIQCRHKMEKLRKRYRTEIQRSRSLPVSRFNSSWVHFKLMDSMEKGPSPVKPENVSDNSDNDNEDDDDDQDLYQEINHNGHIRSLNKMYRNGFPGSGAGSGAGGFRIRIPTGLGTVQPGSGSKVFGNQKFSPNLNQNPNPNLGNKRERDPVGELVAAIKVLGDGFVRTEQMKMEMAREIETMRMEMEMKRTEMILESQQRIVEAFAKAISEKKKKAKTVSSPQQP
ncbi:hypothetical protein AAZX31_07G236300 [Glycine max]|uniref:Protein FIP2 n=1 Tax=Glycine soja TaxID=3848 RepID=A0A445K1J0_GLYSO|nr:trihelix transcription factor ASIL2-like [Glycine soja]XP_040873486.1 trihelix transcription factor ASIL2-like [Glycine max]KAG4401354.1 hypothetical protein GLYMA_07G254502v4 [Glycine max]KAG5023940.1 hypothetical protein JHK85_020282 [Glycine max]KAG5039014.1 hypothetical protein JHK86_019854 [Glycine max]KAG5144136.1 hypothetical protein JHK82_019831 [Glycine max]KAH1088587.1 hypothetical protein GYH30_019565 [Glycine max]